MVYEQPFSELSFHEIAKEHASPGAAAVAGLPMSSMSREKRGKRIQEIGLAIDRRLHPQSHFHLMQGNTGQANAPADWVRDNKMIELKSCILSWDQSHKRWQCSFQWIKPDLFDELWLAIYTVVGIHFYRSESVSLAFGTTGVLTKIHGHRLSFSGPRNKLDPVEAYKTIQAKMISTGCELVAVVEWEKGSSMPCYGTG